MPYVTETSTRAINPLNWNDGKPLITGSPEGLGFVMLVHAAWRDCVLVDRYVKYAEVDTNNPCKIQILLPHWSIEVERVIQQ